MGPRDEGTRETQANIGEGRVKTWTHLNMRRTPVLTSKPGTSFLAHNVDPDLWEALIDTFAAKRPITNISIGVDGRWAMTAGQWFASSGLSKQMLGGLKAWQRWEFGIDHLLIGPSYSYVLYSHGKYKHDPNDPIERFEYGFPGGKNIWQRMHHLNVPGTSIAIIEGNEITQTRGYGELAGGTQRFVRTTTPFYMGSCSKFMASLGAMKLVSQGKLQVDTSVFDLVQSSPYDTIAMWTRFMSDHEAWFGYTEAPPLYQGKITLERLLSHTASMVFGGGLPGPDGLPFYGTLYQLCGHDGSGWNQEWRVWTDGTIPGTKYDYSGAGYYLAEAFCEQVTGQSFADAMDDLVFKPLNMDHSTFQWPLSDEWDAVCSKFHDKTGTPRPTRVETRYAAAGGLYSSPADFARAMLVVMLHGLTPEYGYYMSSAAAQEILTARHAFKLGGYYGLGVGLNASGTEFGHSGYLFKKEHIDGVEVSWNAGATFLADKAKQKGFVAGFNFLGDPEEADKFAFLDEATMAYKAAYGF